MLELQNKREMFEKALAQKDFETARAIISDAYQLDNIEDHAKIREWERELNAAADKELHV